MNQLSRSGSFTKSASAFASTKSQSPTYNGYVRFAKAATPISSPSQVILPPHMLSLSYAAMHATKPDIDEKIIALNDLEEGVKLTILSDIERDQRLLEFKDTLNRSFEKAAHDQLELEKKRKADHEIFDKFVQNARRDNRIWEEKYFLKCQEILKLQGECDKLNDKYTDAQLNLDSCVYENNRMETLLTMKNQEIDDLNETLKLYTPQSPNLDALVTIMNAPDLDLKRSADENDQGSDDQDLTFIESPFNNLARPINQPRVYVKKPVKNVTDPYVLASLKHMARSVYTYRRIPFVGMQVGALRYAFYYGKLNSSNVIGMNTQVVLSSDRKVYNISNIESIIEMNWNQDPTTKGKKRGYGHIYLGKLAGEKGFETNLLDVFVSELGIHI